MWYRKTVIWTKTVSYCATAILSFCVALASLGPKATTAEFIIKPSPQVILGVSGGVLTAEEIALGAVKDPSLIPTVPSLYERASKLQGTYGGECVLFVRKLLGNHLDFKGYAGSIKPNIETPALGRAVLLKYKGQMAHAAAIIGIDGEWLVLAESNYHLDGKVEIGRKILSNDPYIRGYFAF